MKSKSAESSENFVMEPKGYSREGRVQARAYEIYLERGDTAGSEIEDWLQAEAEIGRRP